MVVDAVAVAGGPVADAGDGIPFELRNVLATSTLGEEPKHLPIRLLDGITAGQLARAKFVLVQVRSKTKSLGRV